jgi:hypothetical protein
MIFRGDSVSTDSIWPQDPGLVARHTLITTGASASALKDWPYTFGAKNDSTKDRSPIFLSVYSEPQSSASTACSPGRRHPYRFENTLISRPHRFVLVFSDASSVFIAKKPHLTSLTENSRIYR